MLDAAYLLDGVFPARAGMIRRQRRLSNAQPRIPRESGDDPLLNWRTARAATYSPRERG